MAISLSEFIKFYPLRAKRIAWLFGAGSSVSAGVPSAYDLTWDFKRRIYCAEQSYPLALFSNLSDHGLREQIQGYFDSQGACPPFDSSEEYSYYFERAFPSARDRSNYIAQQTSGMELTYGHNVMGILLKHRLIELVFTTNFDKAFENIASQQFKKLEEWYAADLDSGDNGMKFFQSGSRPLIVKLHGDYFSDKTKNTLAELQEQDKKLRDILSLALDNNGLCVMGYSGRDNSVMEVISESIEKDSSLPNGLFWFTRSGSAPLPEVQTLIDRAKQKNKQAEIIEIDTFDTAWADIIKGFDSIPVEDMEKLNLNYHRIKKEPLPENGKKYPLIRLNALPILEYPATARLLKCDVGGTREVNKLIENSNVPVMAIRKRDGVVGFGSDSDFIATFQKNENNEMGLYVITEKDLKRDDSSMKGLLTSALLKALARQGPFRYTKKRARNLLFVDPRQATDSFWAPLKTVLPSITGSIPSTKLAWAAALEITIQYALSQPLLLLSPTVIASKSTTESEIKAIAPFIKEFTATWYNEKYDSILNAWLHLIFGVEKQIIIDAFDKELAGVNASFKLSRTTCFTKTN